MKKEKILKIVMFILLIVILSITIAVVILKYDKKNISEEKPTLTKEIAIQIIESNYDTTNMVLEVEEKENCFVVSLKNKDTNEIEKKLAISKKNAKISEVQKTTAMVG